MPIYTPELIRNCRRCSRELTPGALVCEQCQTLVHSEQLEQLAAEAKALESRGELRQAREHWGMALPLLPANSTQAKWIEDHVRELEKAASQPRLSTQAPPQENQWAKRLGPLAPVAVLLAKAKWLFTVAFKLKFLLSFFAFFGFYWAIYGWKFGIGFAVTILIHEMGHYIDVKRRGLPAEMPVFLPGLGAYVRWQALGVSLETRAAIALAGPLAGFLASAACAAMWWSAGNIFWAAIARASAVINLLNLIPVWALDGGQAAVALSKNQRLLLIVACAALWYATGENTLLLVGLGAVYQAFFNKELPPYPSNFILAYFIAVLAALAGLARLLPGHGVSVQ